MKYKRLAAAVLAAALWLTGCGGAAAPAAPAGSGAASQSAADTAVQTAQKDRITEQFTLEKTVRNEWGSAQKLTIHVPQLVCDSPDAEYINNELAAMYAAEYRDYESYPQAEVSQDEWCPQIYIDWDAYWYGDCVSLVVRSYYGGTDPIYSQGWCFDFAAGHKLSVTELLMCMGLDPDETQLAVYRAAIQTFDRNMVQQEYYDSLRESGMLSGMRADTLRDNGLEDLTVLLKNENQLLPLDAKSLKSIAIIGPNADQVQFGDYTWSRNNKDGVTPLQGIKNRVNKNTAIHYAKGCSLTSLDTSGIAEAVEAAKNSEVAVIFGGSASAALARDYKSSTCGEGFDLNDLNLTGAQSQLIREVYRTGTPVILVLVTGKPFVIEWEKNNLPAILVQWYAGEQAGNSIADILFGEVVPSGRLTFSFPRSTGHLPVYYNYLPSDRGFYKNPGSYDSPGRDYVFSAPSALYSFGYGLSYTSFVYKNLSTDKDKYELNDTIHATVEVKNTGKYTGKEVVQLYVRDKASTYVTPVKQLRDFKKIELAPGETRTVQLQVPISDLYLVDEKNQRFVEAGEFILEVGQASNNIILSKTIVAGEPSTIGNDEIVKPKNKKSSRQMEVKGEVRDVQATLVPDMQIIEKSTGKTIAVTDAKGQFKFTTGNHEYLIFKKSGYQTVEIEVNNMNVINITVNYGEN